MSSTNSPIFVQAPTGEDDTDRHINIGGGRVAEYRENYVGDKFNENEYELVIWYTDRDRPDVFKGEIGLTMMLSLTDFVYQNKVEREAAAGARARLRGRG